MKTGQKRPKILMSISYHLPNISGIGVYVKNLSEELAKKGYDVTVLTSLHEKKLEQKTEINNVRIRRIPIDIQLGKGPIMFRYPFLAYKYVKSNDIIHCHLPQFEAIFLAIFAKLFGKKLLVTSHTDLSLWKGLFNFITFTLVNISHFFTFLLADKISTYTEDYAKHSYISKYFLSKIKPILPPIILPKPKKNINLNIDNKYLKIGFVGRIAKQKGLHFLLDSIPYLKEKLNKPFKIVLIGPSKEVIGENHIAVLKDKINKYKKYLSFTGKIDFQNIKSVYTQLDVLVLPSHDTLESFGFVQVESMFSGTPVVASNLPGVRIPIKKTKMGEIIEVGNPQDIANKISIVLKNKHKYTIDEKKLKSIFDYRNTINEYEKLYSSNK